MLPIHTLHRWFQMTPIGMHGSQFNSRRFTYRFTALALAVALPSLAAPPRRGPEGGTAVHITVTSDSASAPVANAYVALIPRDEPLRRPLHETIAVDGTADFTVAPGSYLLAATADGYDVDNKKIVVVRPTPAPLTVNLAPEHFVRGLVSDAAGRPIANARVAQALAALPSSVGMLSAMATTAFGDRLHTTTDTAGAWKLTVSAGKKLPLLVEAPGYAPAWVLYDPSGDERDEVNVTLEKGSTLEATLDRLDPDAMISIVAKSQEGQQVPAGFQPRVWGREATSNTVTWDSLAPGEYRVLVIYPDPLRFAAPVEAATVTLTAGGNAELHVKVPPAPAREPQYARFFVPATTALPALHAFVRKGGGGVQEARHREEETTGGTLIYVAGARSPEDAYLITDKDLITASPRVPGPNHQGVSATRTVELPRGTGKLRVTVPQDIKLPASATAQLHDCSQPGTVSLPLNVTAAGEIEVPLAVPCRAATIQFDNFGPVTVATFIRQGEQKWLGDHALLAPASVEVHVVGDQTNADAADAVVQAMVRRGSDVRLIPVAEATTNEQGRAVLKNVPAGEEVTFQARHAKTKLVGTATARVEAGKRTVIDPLPMPEPASLTVSPQFDPDFKSQYPAAVLLGVTISREDVQPADRRTINFDKAVTEGAFHDIPPGRWNMTVLVNVDGSKELMDADAVTLTSGEEKQVSPAVRPVVVNGQVLAQGQGVAATLLVGDAPGSNAIRRRVYTAPDGKFKVIVPHSTIYYVQAQRISNAAPTADLGPLLFDGSPLRIELPEGALNVHVTRGGQPLPGAQIVAVKRVDNPDGSGVSALTRRAKTDDSGLATLDELAEGTWAVQALSPDDDHVAQKEATVARTRAELALDVEESNTFEGTVFDASTAPAVSASVDCVFSSGQTLQAARAETSFDGRFTIHLPKPAPQSLQCGVTTVDGAVGAFASTVSRNAKLVMPPTSGTVTIADWGQRVIPDRFWLVGDDGSLFNLSWVARKVGRMGAPLVISRVPAGRWTVVQILSTAQLLGLGRGTARSLPAVAELTVQPGQSTTINIQNATTVANR